MWTGRIILTKRLAGAVVILFRISGIYRLRLSCLLKTCGAPKMIFRISSVGSLKLIYLEVIGTGENCFICD